MKIKILKILYPTPNKPSKNGFTILKTRCMSHRLDCADAVNEYGEDAYNQEITVKGFNLDYKVGSVMDVEGKWQDDKYGRAFSVKSSLKEIGNDNKGAGPSTTKVEDEVEILANIAGGIGVRAASLIIEALSPNVIDKLDKEPDLILSVAGLSDRKKGEIRKGYIQQRIKALRIKDLKSMGLSTRKASILFELKKEKCVDVLKLTPYFYTEVLGFQTIEKIIENNSLPYTETERNKAFMVDILKEYEKAGHCCMPYGLWYSASIDYLKCSSQMILRAAEELIKEKRVTISEGPQGYYVYREKTFNAEKNAAVSLIKLLRQTSSNITEVDKDIDEMEKNVGFALAPEQRNAVATALKNSVSVITGGPGTGKSTIIHFIRSIYETHFNGEILMFAPTGKAARRMQETTGCNATTVHKGLQLKVNDAGEFHSPSKIKADFVIIDEFSMTDIFLADMLFKSIKPGAKVVIVGDVDQLPSVGAGTVLKDIIASGVVPVAVLSKVYRQNGDSTIAVNAHLMKNGNFDFDYDDSYQMIVKDDFNSAADEIEKLYLKEVKRVGVDNVIYLSPYRKTKAATSVNSFNERIRDKVNPPSSHKPEIMALTKSFRVGDRVMQSVNTPYVSNGEVGYVKSIDGDTAVIDFNGTEIVYDKVTMDTTLDLAYATTVHKSQGSEYPVVIFNLQDEHGNMKKRNLLYTAVTRAKKKVIIVGSKKAVNEAVQCSGETTDRRFTMLATRLRAAEMEIR